MGKENQDECIRSHTTVREVVTGRRKTKNGRYSRPHIRLEYAPGLYGRSRNYKEYDKRDTVVRQLGYGDYLGYLRSEDWKKIRHAAFLRCRNCEVCKGRAEIIHHVSYDERVLLGLNVETLVSLCHSCHNEVEFENNGFKRTLRQACDKLHTLLSGVGNVSTKKRVKEGMALLRKLRLEKYGGPGKRHRTNDRSKKRGC